MCGSEFTANFRHSVNVFQPPVENNDTNGDTMESVREGFLDFTPLEVTSNLSNNVDDSPVCPN